jgi:hypothetical protein
VPSSRFERLLRRCSGWTARGLSVEQQVREERAREAFPYVVEFGVPADYSIPSGFDCARFRGLRFCHVLALSSPRSPAPTEAKVVTFWRDQESYALQASSVAAALGVGGVGWQGYQNHVRTRDKPRWWTKTASVYLLAVHAVAVVGTFEALRSHYGELFAPGDVQVYSQDAEYHVVSDQLDRSDDDGQLGEPFRLSYKVRNVGAATTALSLRPARVAPVIGWDPSDPLAARPDCASARTSVSNPASKAGAGLTLRDPTHRIPQVTVGGVEEISISGVARRSGRFCVAVDGTSQSGILRRLVLGDSPFRADLNVRVWPPLGIGAALAEVSRDRCVFRVVLQSGLAFPDGVGMTATLKRTAGAAFRFVHPVAWATEPKTDLTAGTELTELRWITHPLEARKDTRLALELRKPGATERGCQEIAPLIVINRVALKELRG